MAVQSRSPSAFCSRLANPLVPSSRPACALPPYAPASPPSREPPPPPSVPPPSAPPRSQLRADSQPCPPEGAACQGEAAVASPPAQPQQEQPRRLASRSTGCIAARLSELTKLQHHPHHQPQHHQQHQAASLSSCRPLCRCTTTTSSCIAISRANAALRPIDPSPGSGTILPFPHSNVEMTTGS